MSGRSTPRGAPRGRAPARTRSHHAERFKHRRAEGLGVIGGLSALSLDALSSVAYGPEAMMLVLVAAGTGALSATLPLTLVITGMLVLLVLSYGQVIAAHPAGGGALAVVNTGLGRGCGQSVACALCVDYVLTVAVSLA